MAIKVEIDMPEMCSDCPMFERAEDGIIKYWRGRPLNGKCKVLPLKDYGGRIIDYQTVSTINEIENSKRSMFCPLKECK